MILTKDNILNKIKSNGFWRVNFRPLVYKKNEFNTIELQKLIYDSVVEFSGWDFPHYPTHNEDFQKIEYGDGYFQGLTNYGPFKEFWKFYESHQFIIYLGFQDDWYQEHFWPDKRAALKHITPGNFLGFFYSIVGINCQIFTFAKNLALKGIYKDGLEIDIKLFNTKDREIWDQGKFWRARTSKYRTESNTITSFSSTVSGQEIMNDYWNLANKSIRKVNSAFGLTLDAENIAMYQEQIKNGE